MSNQGCGVRCYATEFSSHTQCSIPLKMVVTWTKTIHQLPYIGGVLRPIIAKVQDIDTQSHNDIVFCDFGSWSNSQKIIFFGKITSVYLYNFHYN